MYFKPVFLICLVIFLQLNAKAQVKTVYLSSFGAIANDNKSDHLAFTRASQYINSRKGNTRLVITKGNYIVGVLPKYLSTEDIPTGAASLNDVMDIVNCNNVTIEGAGLVTIKFTGNIPIGTLANRKNNKDSAVHAGAFIRLTNCTNITLLNLNADGNNQNFRLLKVWGAGVNPYERENEGLYILNCQRVKVFNSSFNGFCRDGALILQDADKIPVKNIAFTNCSFNNNGRNGFSWCGGDSVTFYKCVFKNNCMGKIQTNPGSGLDIEPERYALCTNGKITKCEFSGNGGYALTSGYPTASDVVFDSCTIMGNTNYALICQSPKFRFKNCALAGTCLLYYDTDTEAEGINFTNCTFADSIANKKVYTLNYLVATLGKYIRFNKCTFYSYKVPGIFSEIKKETGLTKKENTYYKNCSFVAYFIKPSTWQRHAFLLSNSVFEDCNFKTKGYADFKYILTEAGRNIQQERSMHIIIK
jgi:hypothetical protein